MLRPRALLASLALLAAACSHAAPVSKVARSSSPPPGPYEIQAGDGTDAGPIPVTSADPSRGSPLAPVTIVEFADFQCGFCQRAAGTMVALQRELGPERVRLVWKNFPLAFHRDARGASEAAMALFEQAGAAGFWRYHDAVFASREGLGRTLFEEAVGKAGSSMDEVIRTARDGGPARKIEADEKLGHAIGVTGTPTFYVNGVLVHGAQPIERFREIVNEQLRAAGALASAGTPADRIYPELTRRQLAAPEREEEEEEPEDKTVYKVPVGASPVRGKPTALVTVVELADFECPFCARAEEPLRQAAARFGDKVRVVWKSFPLPFHKHAEPAAELAAEALSQKGPDAFWKAHDLLLAQTDRLEPEDLEAVAKTLGLDVKRASRAVTGRAHAAAIAADQELADDLGVTGTPTFFVNGRKLVGALPADALAAAITEQLALAEAAVARGVAPAGVYDALQANAKLAPLDTVTVPAPTAASPSRGPANAKVVLEIWSDFECPFCKRVEPTLAELDAAFPGQIRFVWHNHPLAMHSHAHAAAEAAMEAFAQKGNAGFWRMHDLLLENQGGAGQERAALEQYATAVGLDLPRFRAALDGSIHRAGIDADTKLAEGARLDATPGIVINGYRVSGAQPLARFKKIVRRALAEAK